MRIAKPSLDEDQSAALTMADWSALKGRAGISVFTDHVADDEVLAKRFAAFNFLLRHARKNIAEKT
jgi:hypothetical protein